MRSEHSGQRAEPDQPDTAAIRADLQHDRGCLKFDPFHRIIDLCDALDAARAQVAALTTDSEHRFRMYSDERDRSIALRDRAEKAEAERDELRALIAECGCQTEAGWEANDRFRELEATVDAVRALCDRADSGHPKEIKAIHVSRIRAILDGPTP